VRRLVAAAAILLAAGAARAEDAWQPGSVRREVAAAADAGDLDRAWRALDLVLDERTPRIRARHVEAARAAWELLPRDKAAARTARLLAEALRMDPGDEGGAWKLAQDLRKDLLRRVDLDSGALFLAKLIEIYPNVPLYRHDLALLSLDGGRRDEARVQLTAQMEMAPSDPWPAYTLAVLLEEDEDVAGAAAVYDRILDTQPGDLRAHLFKAKLLAGKDPSAARAAIETGVRAAQASRSETERAELLDAFAYERRRLDAAAARLDAIDAIRDRTRRTTGAALAAWAVVAVIAFRLTRTSAPGAPSGATPPPAGG
jgi:tetratricopeptide repeat protein